ALAASKIYLFLLPVPGSTRERIVGCVVAQSIETAMKIVEKNTPALDNLVHVDGSIYCDLEDFRYKDVSSLRYRSCAARCCSKDLYSRLSIGSPQRSYRLFSTYR
ncbi:11105_t:CDS:2, partial [Acaulospora colombiana]